MTPELKVKSRGDVLPHVNDTPSDTLILVLNGVRRGQQTLLDDAVASRTLIMPSVYVVVAT